MGGRERARDVPNVMGRESEGEREQSLCPLTQRVCLSASIADGASEYAITTPMTDISLTLESVCMEKSRGGEGCAEKKKKTPHYSPDASPIAL